MQKTTESLHLSTRRNGERRDPLHRKLTELSRQKAPKPKSDQPKKHAAAGLDGASMEYQQGFTSGGAL